MVKIKFYLINFFLFLLISYSYSYSYSQPFNYLKKVDYGLKLGLSYGVMSEKNIASGTDSFPGVNIGILGSFPLIETWHIKSGFQYYQKRGKVKGAATSIYYLKFPLIFSYITPVDFYGHDLKLDIGVFFSYVLAANREYLSGYHNYIKYGDFGWVCGLNTTKKTRVQMFKSISYGIEYNFGLMEIDESRGSFTKNFNMYIMGNF